MNKLKANTKKKEVSQKPLIEVPLDQTGKLANRFVDIIDQIRGAEEDRDAAGAALIEALKAQGRSDIMVRGVKLSIKEIEAKVKIAVKRPKED